MKRQSSDSNAIQLDLFAQLETEKKVLERLEMSDAEVTFYHEFFERNESREMFTNLLNEIEWRQDKMKFYGKEVDLPRKTAWYGDSDKSYTFSGITLNPKPWTPTLLEIKQRIEEVAKVNFNSVLLNLYRNGSDGISWHTDAEPELGKNPVIGSVSFGASRRFIFRRIDNKDLKTEIELTDGSFLLMGGATQHYWQHQVPKTSQKVEPRINLTFRVIL
ncbi:alpha-ketoglutarate-dependent dioxygenase AlkB family protein [Argonema antarcticum]|uniref:alpha-ketoglutarate-dependent dioxygenase AlkB family protein n=1 Tax=Argonema antarcticum TaxID=2942763 RepID=UPI0020123916|nr:alpha-ketoglutarate-dependent dioxygenase AlkB [Argonema antarcticum]MCL1470466.1 alpha-ketoglutarate-dependent dioxygenase AlkB [Argonema antarcticum A004/B2]